MKKIIVLFLCFALVISFSACGDTDKSNENSSTASHGDNQINESSNIQSTTEKPNDVKTEYVETYNVYAEEGAVVTSFDSKTGEFSYKAKCETCGKTESGTHNGLRGGHNTTYSSSYSCQNAQCSMWGKSQPVKIGCEVKGEWIEVSN